MSRFTHEITFVTEDCIYCTAPFAMNKEHYTQRKRDGKSFYCPSCGKSMVYRQTETEEERKLRETQAELKQAQKQVREHALAARRAEGKAIEVNKAYLKIRNRVRKGMCPCCNETFQNLAQHMQAKHPEFGAPDLLKTLREAYGLTQAALAKEIGAVAAYICNYEHGRSVPSYTKRLIDAWLAKQITV